MRNELESFCEWARSSPRASRATERWAAVIQFEPTDGTGEPGYLTVGPSIFLTGTGCHINPTVKLRGNVAGLWAALRGEIDVTHLLARGEATVSGNYYDALNLSRLALARRRAGT